MKVLSVKGKISEKNDKTNISFKFNVSNNAKRLVVKYSYFPKEVEERETALELLEEGIKKYGICIDDINDLLPVRNLVTVSFDENGEYRGACHRHANEQTIIISDKNSTPGIINRALKAGDWRAVLNVHYAGCEVNYSIDIEEETK